MGEQISEDAGQPVMVHKKPDIGDKAIAMAEKFRHENGLADIYALMPQTALPVRSWGFSGSGMPTTQMTGTA